MYWLSIRLTWWLFSFLFNGCHLFGKKTKQNIALENESSISKWISRLERLFIEIWSVFSLTSCLQQQLVDGTFSDLLWVPSPVNLSMPFSRLKVGKRVCSSHCSPHHSQGKMSEGRREKKRETATYWLSPPPSCALWHSGWAKESWVEDWRWVWESGEGELLFYCFSLRSVTENNT